MAKSSAPGLKREFKSLESAIAREVQGEVFHEHQGLCLKYTNIHESMYGAFLSFLRLNKEMYGVDRGDEKIMKEMNGKKDATM